METAYGLCIWKLALVEKKTIYVIFSAFHLQNTKAPR